MTLLTVYIVMKRCPINPRKIGENVSTAPKEDKQEDDDKAAADDIEKDNTIQPALN